MSGCKRRGVGLALGLCFGLVSGCAAQSEESGNRDAQLAEDEVERSEAKLAPNEPTAAAPEAEAKAESEEVAEEEDAPRGLDELERELAVNNAKLRKLGIETKTEAKPSGDGVAGGARDKPSKKTTEKGPGAGKGAATKPSKSKSKDDRVDLDPQPEQVKSAPLAPSDAHQNQGAAGRCQQICDLSAISCELGDQICELADRHAQERHYESACERAIGDCDAAKEACDACE